MSLMDFTIIVALFAFVLCFGGAIADSRERRDARNRNQARRMAERPWRR